MIYRIFVQKELIGTVKLSDDCTQRERDFVRRQISIERQIPMHYIRLSQAARPFIYDDGQRKYKKVVWMVLVDNEVIEYINLKNPTIFEIDDAVNEWSRRLGVQVEIISKMVWV
jgi:hypothetical protein